MIQFDCRPGPAAADTLCFPQSQHRPSCPPAHLAAPIIAVRLVQPVALHNLTCQSTDIVLGQLGLINCHSRWQRWQMTLGHFPFPPPPHMLLSLVPAWSLWGHQRHWSHRECHQHNSCIVYWWQVAKCATAAIATPITTAASATTSTAAVVVAIIIAIIIVLAACSCCHHHCCCCCHCHHHYHIHRFSPLPLLIECCLCPLLLLLPLPPWRPFFPLLLIDYWFCPLPWLLPPPLCHRCHRYCHHHRKCHHHCHCCCHCCHCRCHCCCCHIHCRCRWQQWQWVHCHIVGLVVGCSVELRGLKDVCKS